MKEEYIVHTAIENLKKALGIEARWDGGRNDEFDGVLTIDIKGTRIAFNAEVKREVRNYQLEPFINKARYREPAILIANKIYPKIKEILREEGIAYLEANGNVYIREQDVLLWIDGNKTQKENKVKVKRAFTKTGIKVLFLYLLDQEWLNRPYREVAKKAGVALGTILPIREALTELGYLIKLDHKRVKLINKDELINKWVEAYEEVLKPNITLGRFKLHTNEDYDWRKLNFNYEELLWGGEPAADILTNHLNPENLTLYTNQKINDLITKYRLIPAKNGQITIYEKFWDLPQENMNTVPPLLVYADLINTGDSRCIETAKIIYNEYVGKDL